MPTRILRPTQGNAPPSRDARLSGVVYALASMGHATTRGPWRWAIWDSIDAKAKPLAWGRAQTRDGALAAINQRVADGFEVSSRTARQWWRSLNPRPARRRKRGRR